ncbi:hypothetical protein [Actinacidiphila glaucinigra]|uniref:hypothetical protein n=1 Tax=Actinacidiphila glaucinigra TaxID=235986 RepID=UPI0029ADE6E2|nr:hypothetical protein [Streptomyces sp. PA03-3a]
MELLEWLASLVYDTDDELYAKLRRRGEVSPEIEAVRALRPLFFQAVAAFLDDATPAVRHAAVNGLAAGHEAGPMASGRRGRSVDHPTELNCADLPGGLWARQPMEPGPNLQVTCRPSLSLGGRT